MHVRLRRFTLGLAAAALLAQAPPVSASDYFEQITIDATVGGVGFTLAKIEPAGEPQMTVATCRLELAEVRYTHDATIVTSSVGVLLEPGDTLTIAGHDRLVRFHAIRTTATSGQLDCHYSR